MKIMLQILLCLTASLSAAVIAGEEDSRWSIKGFGTLGLTQSDTDRLGFFRNWTVSQETTDSLEVLTDSRLGIQLDVEINDAWSGAAQFIFRDHAGKFFEQNLDGAFLRWYPSDDMVIRFGRMQVDHFLLSDYTNVGYAYSWVRPPHEFYGAIPFTHYDGIEIKKTFFMEKGNLSLKVHTGSARVDLSKAYQSLDTGGFVAGIKFEYEQGSWRSNISYDFIGQNKEMGGDITNVLAAINNPVVNTIIPGISDLTDDISIEGSKVHFLSIGTVYDDGIWLGQAEASYRKAGQVVSRDLFSGYVSIGRRFSDVTLFSTYGITHSYQSHIKVPDVVLPVPQMIALQKQIDWLVNKGDITDQQSATLGLRWDFHQKMAFKAQWTHFMFGEDGTSLWLTSRPGKNPDQVDLFSIGIDFIF